MFYHDILKNLESRGEAIAYKSESGSLSFAQMRRNCAGICALLRENEQRAPVIVYGHKEPFFKSAILACVFCGIPYIPVDRSFPQQRVESIIAQAHPFFILGDFESAHCAHVPSEKLEAIRSEQALQIAARQADDICYMIFTSGSTGAPKGVKITYANLDSCIRWLVQLSGDCDCILNQAKFSFDLTVADFYLSAVLGATHFALTDRALKDFRRLFAQLGQSQAQLAVMTPSFAKMLLTDRSFGSALMPRLQTIIFCGETLACATAKKLSERFPGLRIINCYGPTEATFAVTGIVIQAPMWEAAALPVGRAKPGVSLQIREDGEIVIVGDSVAKGYLPPADNSAFGWVEGQRSYRTGDYGYLQDGILYFGGRRDNQVKYGGFRIELGEIENALLSLPQVANARVLAKRSKSGEVQAIRAFAVPEKGVQVSAASLQEALAAVLPAYMLPKIQLMEALPLNANEKSDDKQLAGE